MKTKKFLSYLEIFIPLIIILIYSLLNMKNAALIKDSYKVFFNRQLLFIGIGFILIFILQFIKPKWLFKYSRLFYVFSNILLLLLIIFGKEVNGAKAWFNLGFISFQPSELMKLSLILYLTKVISEFEIKNNMDEFKLILKVLLITFIPAIITFLEPDTGAVIIYFVIAFTMLFFSNIKKRWFIYLIILIIIFAFLFFYLYFYQKNIFIKYFGTHFFYRMDRLIDFKSQNGLQLENALISIGSSGLKGSGINKVMLYFPEAPTDFIFSLTLSNFGLIGGFIVLINYILLDLFLSFKIKENNYSYNNLFIAGFLGMFIFQQMQNILMNIGLLPIVGITLPFLSYGGSSTLVYFVCLGIILKLINISNHKDIIEIKKRF